MALHFIPNPENKPTINHKDGIKNNNDLNNLEWATLSEQVNHAIENNLLTFEKLRGVHKWNSVLDPEKVKEIRELYNSGVRKYKIAKKLNVSQNIVADVLNKKTWKHIN